MSAALVSGQQVLLRVATPVRVYSAISPNLRQVVGRLQKSERVWE